MLGCVGLSVTASGTESACLDLFAQGQLTKYDGSKLAPQLWKELNDASKEYLTRLRFLVSERRMVSAEVYQRVLDSSAPLNPLGDRAVSVNVLPHQEAFTHLLKEDLQWD